MKKICKNCDRHRNRKWKECRYKEESETCDKWAIKKDFKICSNCKFFKSKSCDSQRPAATCDHWKYTKKDAPKLPGRDEILTMLRTGTDADQIAGTYNISLTGKENRVGVADPQIEILKHHLNTVLSVLPAAELAYRIAPNQNNAYALTNLIEASRALQNDINARTDPTEVYTRIIVEVIEPLTRQFVELLTVEMSRMRPKIHELIPMEKKGFVNEIINETIKSLAPEMESRLAAYISALGGIIGVAAPKVVSGRTRTALPAS